jgi:pyridoxamine 5'-phosphate oxidase
MTPINRFKEAMKRAADSGLQLPDGAALATADKGGRPSVRIVLIKDVDERGFVFYTNLSSRKGRELEENARASMCVWWPQLQEQVRIEGSVTRVEDADADEYWKTRPRPSQLGAWASRQSEPLASHEDLEKRFQELDEEYVGREVPRPPFWSGFRLVPERIEFWHGREDRLHSRESFERTDRGWRKRILAP